MAVFDRLEANLVYSGLQLQAKEPMTISYKTWAEDKPMSIIVDEHFRFGLWLIRDRLIKDFMAWDMEDVALLIIAKHEKPPKDD